MLVDENDKKIRVEEDCELTEHQKAEIMFMEFLSRKKKREEIVFQYPIPSTKNLEKARVIVPDISEYPSDWEPCDYLSSENFTLPKNFLKSNGMEAITTDRL